MLCQFVPGIGRKIIYGQCIAVFVFDDQVGNADVFSFFPKTKYIFQLQHGLEKGRGILHAKADADTEDAEGTLGVKPGLDLG